MTKHLSAQGYTQKELAQSGLASEGQRGVYDRFRGRIVWPIRDTSGQTVGFGARKLYEDDNGPKYLNTPDTPLFHKGAQLFAAGVPASDATPVLVEGPMDAIAVSIA